MDIIVLLLVGLVVGVLAQFIMGGGLGWILSIVLGVVGCVLGGWIFGRLGIGGGGLVMRIIAGVVGACLIIFIVRLITG